MSSKVCSLTKGSQLPWVTRFVRGDQLPRTGVEGIAAIVACSPHRTPRPSVTRPTFGSCSYRAPVQISRGLLAISMRLLNSKKLLNFVGCIYRGLQELQLDTGSKNS